MLYRKMFTALALAGAILIPTASFAATERPANDPSCVLREYHVASVAPYRHERVVGQGQSVSELIGASMFVPATPGLTAEWLRARFEGHLAEMRKTPMRDCAFDLEGVSVIVDSAGLGFSVKLVTDDTKKAEEVLRRARLMLG
ncbi:MAG TPA: hypothetical protein VNO21_18995 [Polyangiaceae bacterium]|nr:hypothetical protein [Polyangiaceae bacterium]